MHARNHQPGFQWRHFGAEYVDMHADYAGKGIDQLARAIETIKANPEDRRIIVSAWCVRGGGAMARRACSSSQRGRMD